MNESNSAAVFDFLAAVEKRDLGAAFALHADEITEAGERVVVRGRLRGPGRLSGTSFELPLVQLWWFRDRLARRLEYHLDTAALLTAVEAPPAAWSE